MSKLFIGVVIVMFAFTSTAQTQISQNCLSDISFIQKELNLNHNKLNDKLLKQFPINTIHGVSYLSFLAKVNSDFNSTSIDNSILVGAKVNDIVSLKIPLSELNDIEYLTGIEILQVAGKIKPTLNKVLKDVRTDSVHAGIIYPKHIQGKMY